MKEQEIIYPKFKQVDFTHLNMGHCNSISKVFEICLPGHYMHGSKIQVVTETKKEKTGRLTNQTTTAYFANGKRYDDYDQMIVELELPAKGRG